jgi:hypothetical protein
MSLSPWQCYPHTGLNLHINYNICVLPSCGRLPPAIQKRWAWRDPDYGFFPKKECQKCLLLSGLGEYELSSIFPVFS